MSNQLSYTFMIAVVFLFKEGKNLKLWTAKLFLAAPDEDSKGCSK